MDFTTLGMFILDDIDLPPPRGRVTNILGGAGTYAALGARLFSPPPLSKSVGWIMDCGSDFPDELREVVGKWESGCVVRETPERLTTRGWNGYGEGEHRAFRYLTPKIRLSHDDLINTRLLHSRSFHLICSPARCISLVQNILALRLQDPGTERPLFIWEPVPDLCTPNESEKCLEALRCVDVVSPNHGELGGFFGQATDAGAHVDYRAIEALCERWLESGIGRGGGGGVVVRSGKDGCLVARRGMSKWLPAYHQSGERVVDPTGGGNAFLGGLAVGLVRCGGVAALDEAAGWGAVAASFAIEQIGLPVLEQTGAGETWNGVRVEERVGEFKQRLDSYVQP